MTVTGTVVLPMLLHHSVTESPLNLGTSRLVSAPAPFDPERILASSRVMTWTSCS